MISKIQKLFLMFCAGMLCLCMYGCSSFGLNDKKFTSAVGVKIDNYLDIIPVALDPITTHTTISLYLANKTYDCVVFPYDYGLKILAYQDQDWVEIPGTVQSKRQDGSVIEPGGSPDQDIVLDPNGKANPDIVIVITPDYSKLGPISTPQRLRIVLIGRQCSNGIPSDQPTADYFELSVKP